MIMLYYFIAISVFAVVICVYDKLAAKLKLRRVRETFLFFVSFIGGALAMYITMLVIRHKTRHISFMVGIPLMVVLHIIVQIVICVFF